MALTMKTRLIHTPMPLVLGSLFAIFTPSAQAEEPINSPGMSASAAKKSIEARAPALQVPQERVRLIVSTDIGGGDPDDFQSMVHLFVYADLFDLEGLISSPPLGGRLEHIHEAIDAYAVDYPNLVTWTALYPEPKALRAISFQGAIDGQSGAMPDLPISVGAQHIIDRAHASDERPLYIAVWGAITDVAQAVHADPSIKERIRVYSIGSWNTAQDNSNARNYLFDNHPDLWWIENDTTFRGMYIGGTQDGDLGNVSFVQNHVKGHGRLGDLFLDKKPDIKMGDTPSILYFLTGDPSNPEDESWGGSFVQTGHSPTFWTDSPDPELREGKRDGAKTVNRWREAYLRDWQIRMDRALYPNPDYAPAPAD